MNGEGALFDVPDFLGVRVGVLSSERAVAHATGSSESSQGCRQN